jgi:hypothetical protein
MLMRRREACLRYVRSGKQGREVRLELLGDLRCLGGSDRSLTDHGRRNSFQSGFYAHFPMYIRSKTWPKEHHTVRFRFFFPIFSLNLPGFGRFGFAQSKCVFVTSSRRANWFF